MSTIQIGVDLAKSVFEVAVSEAPGVVTARRRLSRAAFPRFLAAQAPAVVLLEACGSAHHRGRAAHRADRHVRLWYPIGACTERPWFEKSIDPATAARLLVPSTMRCGPTTH